MTVKLHSYLHFNGNAREALDFYQSVFGGEVQADTFAGFAERAPGSGMMYDPAEGDKIMHASLMGSGDIELMLSDVPTSMPAVSKGDTITLTLNGDDEATIKGYWDKLADGGQVSVPLNKAPWGDSFGMLTDKFGVDWMVNITSNQQPATE